MAVVNEDKFSYRRRVLNFDVPSTVRQSLCLEYIKEATLFGVEYKTCIQSACHLN